MHLLLLSIIILGVFSFNLVFAEVLIPDSEFNGYLDSNGIYTIVGVVKNTENYAITSHIEITVHSDGKTISVGQDLPPVAQNKDMPFKIRISGVSQNIILEKPVITFKKSVAPPINIHVLYDKTLIRHDDGHLTGRITNEGNNTEYDIKVYAAIHGPNNKFIDTGINVEKIEKIEPGQIIDFSIYPDPSIASDVNYYSCFAIGDETIIPLHTTRNGDKFNFRYDSTAAFTVNGFDETGTKLSLYGINSFKVPTYVNFEFPKTSNNEKFYVLVNDTPLKFIQSLDEQGNWHVAFDIKPSTQNTVLITGFENPKLEKKTYFENGDTYLYVVPILAALGIGVYFYRHKRLDV